MKLWITAKFVCSSHVFCNNCILMPTFIYRRLVNLKLSMNKVRNKLTEDQNIKLNLRLIDEIDLGSSKSWLHQHRPCWKHGRSVQYSWRHADHTYDKRIQTYSEPFQRWARRIFEYCLLFRMVVVSFIQSLRPYNICDWTIHMMVHFIKLYNIYDHTIHMIVHPVWSYTPPRMITPL